MTKVNLVKFLGDLLVEIDTERGSVPYGTPRRKKLDKFRRILNEWQLELADLIFEEGTAAYKAATDKLIEISEGIKNTIHDVSKVVETFAALEKLITAVDELFMLAVPNIALASSVVSAAMEKRADFGLSQKMRYGAEVTPDNLTEYFSAEKEEVVASPSKIPVEEVLYGVEITPEKLIITVATGGCTGEDSFHVDVNKGYTGRPPYLVTVYRVVPDHCKGNFEPMKVAFSRKELKLEGNVEFTVQNRIGNTSQHRL